MKIGAILIQVCANKKIEFVEFMEFSRLIIYVTTDERVINVFTPMNICIYDFIKKNIPLMSQYWAMIVSTMIVLQY